MSTEALSFRVRRWASALQRAAVLSWIERAAEFSLALPHCEVQWLVLRKPRSRIFPFHVMRYAHAAERAWPSAPSVSHRPLSSSSSHTSMCATVKSVTLVTGGCIGGFEFEME